MKRALILAGACAFLALPAFAQTSSTPQNATPGTSSPSPSSQPAPSSQPSPQASQNAPSTDDFVKNAAISGMFEIQSSELALRKHARSDRSFAKDMIRDHSRADAELKRLVRSDHINVEIPTKLDDEHQKMLDQLRGESGSQFDKDYDQMQQQGHQQAVALFQSYAQNGDNPALKRWAAKTLPILQHHLAMADKLPTS